MAIPDYCTQNGGDCPTCALVNYGRDCQNNPLKGRFFTLAQIAETCTGGNEQAARKLLNDAGAKLDEYTKNPGETIPRKIVIDLLAMRAGDRIGRKLAELLG